MRTSIISIGLLLAVHVGCGESESGHDASSAIDASTPLIPGPREGRCEHAKRVGGFEITLKETFTTLQGKITSAVNPQAVSTVEETSGPCQLLRPPSLFCDPACASGETCAPSNQCVAVATGLSVGDVLIEGLGAEVQMEGPAFPFFYLFVGDLPHPPFAEAEEVILRTLGEANIPPFALRATGIAALVVTETSVPLVQGQPIALTWQAATDPSASDIGIELNIAQHGGTAGRIACEVPDTGSFELPVSLTNALLASGFSGFPSIAITRHSSDSQEVAPGCVELVVQSQVTLPVEIDGLISCSDPEDCPDGQNCRADLTCG